MTPIAWILVVQLITPSGALENFEADFTNLLDCSSANIIIMKTVATREYSLSWCQPVFDTSGVKT